jgi:hypothetical protein
MKTALRGVLLLAALAGASCGRAPTVPSTVIVNSVSLTPPADPVLSARYLLSVTASLSCDQGTPIVGTFDFELVKKFPDGAFLVQPVNRQIDGPNSGSVTLLVLGGTPPGMGMLTGTGLAADGVHIVSFGGNVTAPLEGYAYLIPTTGAPPNEMTGDLQHAISVSVSPSSATSVCWSATHKYKLTPKS